jgi:hypothetical protein
MSKPNKVNPGMYTQRGRLTPDDAARELRKQRAIGSRHSGPVNPKTSTLREPARATTRVEKAADNEATRETPPQVETSTARRATNRKAASKTTGNGKANAAKTSRRTSKRTTGKARAGKATTTATKQTRKATRNAVSRRSR